MGIVRINRRKFVRCSSLSLLSFAIGQNQGLLDLSNRQKEEQLKIKRFRTLGRTGFQVSDIGCGPVEIRDESLLKFILKSGVNIIDTSEYYSNGNNERMVGRVIKEFDRSSLFLNTKLNIGLNESKSSIISRVNNCLERLQTPYIDCLISANVNFSRLIKKESFHAAIKQLKQEGKIRFCGAACHGTSWATNISESMDRVLMTAVNDGRYDIILMVYNFVQRDMGERVMEACAKKNIGTLAMKTEPFGGYYLDLIRVMEEKSNYGGELSRWEQHAYDLYKKLQEEAKPFLDKYSLNEKEAIRNASVQYILDNPEMHSILISFREFETAAKYLSLSGTSLDNSQARLIDSYRKEFSHYYCRHACGICENVCPHKIPVNTIMRYNHYLMVQKREEHAISLYKELTGNKPDKCSDCSGLCQKRCPYGVVIKELLGFAHKNLSRLT